MGKFALTLVILVLLFTSAFAVGPPPMGKVGMRTDNPGPQTNSSVIYVNTASTAASPTGDSWHTAYPSLATALASDLSEKEEIWVASGTYYPTDGTDRNASFTLVAGIGLYGGFSGYEIIREQRNWKKNLTILSGEIGDETVMTDNALHVVTGIDEAILDGFTIQDGYAVLGEGEIDTSGSLVEVPAESSGMEILRIVTNIKSSSGAGLLNVHAGTVTKNCTFINNHASKGGAVYNMVTSYFDPSNIGSTIVGDAPSFKNCIFDNNSASARGGAINNDFFTTSIFVDCVFSNNTCDAKGGAVYGDMGSPMYFINALFLKNRAARGAALVADGVSSHRIVYGTFVENTANDIGAALYQGTAMGELQDGEPMIGNEVHLYRSIIIGNESKSSSSSVSNWHDGLAMSDEDSILEETEGTLDVSVYLNPNTYASKSRQYGWRPKRKFDSEYWIDLFYNDPNRTYTAYSYDTASLEGTTSVILVDAVAEGQADGTTWADAYTTLDAALEKATAGSQIWVATGIYKPTTGTDRSETFVMKEGVSIYGGFSGYETSLNNRDYLANITILSGDIGIEGDISDNSYHVLFGATGATLDGFVIQDGNADGDFHHSRGGGLLCYDSASPEIINSTFTQNTALEGGAIACYSNSAPTLLNCAITNNAANIGGGILFRTGPDDEMRGAKITRTTFSNNTASDRGGAVYIDYGAWPSFDQCSVSENASSGNGGGVYVDNNSSQLSSIEARFTNCNFTDNSTELRGGAFSIYEGTVFLNSSIIEYNSAITGGGGIALDYMGKYVNISNASTVANNSSISGESDIDDDSTMIEMVPPMETIP